MRFQNIVGNDKVKQFLNKAIEENHILHSYLFVGIEGIGKKLFAREFAKSLLCLNREENETCPSCIKWNSNNHPDFMQIEPENGTIKIEQIRKMQEEIAKKPITSNKKVYIICDSECMTKEAQNCLLKTLEEPPEYVTIILTTANESKLLTTVKSRCIQILFEEISKEDIEKYMREKLLINPNPNFVLMCEGSIGKMLYMQEDEETYEALSKLLNSLENTDLATLWNKAEVLYKQKEKIQEMLNYINVFLYHTKEKNKINCIKHVEDTKKRLLANSNYDMCIDYLLMKMWEEIDEKYSRS